MHGVPRHRSGSRLQIEPAFYARPWAGEQVTSIHWRRRRRPGPGGTACGGVDRRPVLAEIGDDRARFADARGLKAYAGSAPVTRASGKTTAVLHRRVKNQRLASVGYVWAFAALTASPGARAHYDRRKAAGDRHVAAQRNLFNRLLGCLHHCLHTRQTYNEAIAFPTPHTPPRPAPLDKITAWDVFIASARCPTTRPVRCAAPLPR